MSVVDNAAGYFSIIVTETYMPNAIGGALNTKKNLHTNSSDFIWSNSMVPLLSMFLRDQSISICITRVLVYVYVSYQIVLTSLQNIISHGKNLAFFCSWILLFRAYFTAPCHCVEYNAKLLMLSSSSYFNVWCWTT